MSSDPNPKAPIAYYECDEHDVVIYDGSVIDPVGDYKHPPEVLAARREWRRLMVEAGRLPPSALDIGKPPE